MTDRLNAMLEYGTNSKTERQTNDDVKKAGDATRARIEDVFRRQHKVVARLRAV